MPRAAYVDETGRCRRIAVVSDLSFAPGAIDGTGAVLGAVWDGQEWQAPRVQRDVPQVVTMRQARRALAAAGMLSTVDAAISALPEPQRTAAQIDWEFSNVVERGNSTMAALAAALSLTDEQLDDLFIAAGAIA